VSSHEIIEEKNAQIANKDRQIDTLKQENLELRRLIFGSKSEKFISTDEDGNQLALFADQAEEVESEEQTEQINYERKKGKPHPGRNKLPEHLPVEETIIEPEHNVEGMEKIGELVTETLKYTPASLVKKRVIRPKYIDRKTEKMHVAQLPERALPKCIAEPSLLAHIFVSKFVDHLPFYRQTKMFKRDYDWILNPSTLNDWFVAVCTLLKPLHQKMFEKVLFADYIQADESPIKVQDSDKIKSTHQGYLWVYSSPVYLITVFMYRKGRSMHGPKEALTNYKGTIQCDGYKVYDKIGKKEGVQLLRCMAHARRKFFEAKNNDKIRAEYGLKIIQDIYMHERKCKESSHKERKEYRIKHVQPLYDTFKVWLDESYHKVLPKSKIGKAIRYTLTQWSKLYRIFEDGRFEIDNNLIENKIRPLALGRKNFLFAGSHSGAERIAMMYSFFATCIQRNVNPYEWLTETIEKIPSTKINEIQTLIPGYKINE